MRILFHIRNAFTAKSQRVNFNLDENFSSQAMQYLMDFGVVKYVSYTESIEMT